MILFVVIFWLFWLKEQCFFSEKSHNACPILSHTVARHKKKKKTLKKSRSPAHKYVENSTKTQETTYETRKNEGDRLNP